MPQDGTLINTASGRQFAANSTDWKFYNKHVVKKVKEYADDGYKIVIFRCVIWIYDVASPWTDHSYVWLVCY